MRKATLTLLCVLIFAVPWENMIVLPGIGTLSHILGGPVVLIALLTLVFQGGARPLARFHYWFGGLILWCAASFLWSIDPDLSLKSLLTLLQLAILVWLIWEFAPTAREQRGLMAAYVAGAVVSALSTVHAYLLGEQRDYLRFAAAGFDPNDLGLILALSVPLAWSLTLGLRRRWLAWLLRLYVPLAILAIVLTASRSAFICLLVGLCYLLWSLPQISGWARALLLALVPAAGVWLVGTVPAASWQRLSTIGSELGSGTLNSRMDIWQAGLRLFADHPLLGIGFGSFRFGVANSYGKVFPSHNLYLSILVDLGLIGLVIFCAMLLCALLNALRMRAQQRSLWLTLLATWGIGAMALSWQLNKSTWVLLALLVAQAAANEPEAVEERT